MFREAKFQISLADDADHGWRDLVNGVNFRLDEDHIAQVWCSYLRPLLRDLARVAEFSSHQLPDWFSRHLYGSQVVLQADSADPWRDLMLRYRAEWVEWVEHGRQRRLEWAELVKPLKAA